MRRGTKIQKLKQALPGIVKDVRHYAKPRVKLHNEGLGDYYTEGYRSLNQREWKGVRDTAYDLLLAEGIWIYGSDTRKASGGADEILCALPVDGFLSDGGEYAGPP